MGELQIRRCSSLFYDFIGRHTFALSEIVMLGIQTGFGPDLQKNSGRKLEDRMGTWIVLAIVVCVVLLIIRSMVRDKKNGKSLQCGDDCKHCGGHCK